MYGMYPYPAAYPYMERQQEQIPVYTVYRIIPVYLGGKPGTERVVLYTSSNTGLKAKADIQKFEDATKQWVVEYSTEAVGVPYFLMTSGYWEIIRRNVVVFYYSVGSGSYLTYTVVARKRDTLTEIIKKEGLFMGDVWFEGARLIESEGLRYKVWITPNRRLTLIPYPVPRVPGATVIEFSISNDGKVHIPKTKYTIAPDSVVQLIRTDLNSITERVLFSYTPGFRYIKHRNAFRLSDTGTVQIIIIPGGYDWDKAVGVTVEATGD